MTKDQIPFYARISHRQAWNRINKRHHWFAQGVPIFLKVENTLFFKNYLRSTRSICTVCCFIDSAGGYYLLTSLHHFIQYFSLRCRRRIQYKPDKYRRNREKQKYSKKKKCKSCANLYLGAILWSCDELNQHFDWVRFSSFFKLHQAWTTQSFTLLYVVQLAFTASGNHYAHILRLLGIWLCTTHPDLSRHKLWWDFYYHHNVQCCSMIVLPGHIAKLIGMPNYSRHVGQGGGNIPHFCLIIYQNYVGSFKVLTT